MAGFISEITIGMIIFITIIFGLTQFSSELADFTDVQVNQSFNTTLNSTTIEKLNNETDILINITRSNTITTVFLTAPKIISRGGKLVFIVFDTVKGILEKIVDYLPIPRIYIGAFITLLAATIMFYVLGLIFGKTGKI